MAHWTKGVWIEEDWNGLDAQSGHSDSNFFSPVKKLSFLVMIISLFHCSNHCCIHASSTRNVFLTPEVCDTDVNETGVVKSLEPATPMQPSNWVEHIPALDILKSIFIEPNFWKVFIMISMYKFVLLVLYNYLQYTFKRNLLGEHFKSSRLHLQSAFSRVHSGTRR